ncbi:MAG: ABC transporter ATP-binding protein [Nitrospirae bacterium]|nr:ABC transporter ATP-binding protein [Nitrospirota bacterium]MBI3377263.1 ABC transporter ATP-binding protein [Nitrospirota bacterium]
MIILDNISKSFNATHAVKNISLTVNIGEIFGIVGPNGAGKTTTIRMMTGLLTPDKGKIVIGKYDIVNESIKAKSMLGYVPDKAFLYEKLTAREFLIFISSIYSIPRNEALSRIDEMLELFGIKDVEDELIESFSQGMRQRLLFASALIHRPEVFLIDEPFMGLDPFGVRMLKGVIKDLSSKSVTIFLATHSLHIAEELCHRVGFINKGSIISIKTKEEISGMDGGLEGLFLKMGSE